MNKNNKNAEENINVPTANNPPRAPRIGPITFNFDVLRAMHNLNHSLNTTHSPNAPARLNDPNDLERLNAPLHFNIIPLLLIEKSDMTTARKNNDTTPSTSPASCKRPRLDRRYDDDDNEPDTSPMKPHLIPKLVL